MKILNSKAGVTVLEGVIALGLLAVVTAGAFGVLLSAARKSTQPDMREEMALAVEGAKDELQVYINTVGNTTFLPELLKNNLCNLEDEPFHPLVGGDSVHHHITCKLPKICDRTSPKSWFYYRIPSTNAVPTRLNTAKHQEGGTDRVAKLCNNCVSYGLGSTGTSTMRVEFNIQCNGYEL